MTLHPKALPRDPLANLAASLLRAKNPAIFASALQDKTPKYVLALVYGELPEDSPPFTRVSARTLAAMYGHHPKHAEGVRFAKALGRLGDSGVRRRFEQVLDSEADTRGERLVTLMRLAASRGLSAIDYHRLAADLTTLGLRGTQDQWAADFYAQAPKGE